MKLTINGIYTEKYSTSIDKDKFKSLLTEYRSIGGSPFFFYEYVMKISDKYYTLPTLDSLSIQNPYEIEEGLNKTNLKTTVKKNIKESTDKNDSVVFVDTFQKVEGMVGEFEVPDTDKLEIETDENNNVIDIKHNSESVEMDNDRMSANSIGRGDMIFTYKGNEYGLEQLDNLEKALYN